MQLEILIFGPPLALAGSLHEVALGLCALRLGDPTARVLGRLSLNPLKHVDFMMTLVLPGLLILSQSPVIFGGAKPVPVNPTYFRNPRVGMMYVAACGPLTNFIIATVAALLLNWSNLDQTLLMLGVMTGSLIKSWLVAGLLINLVLGLFNLIPVPPLDGGRIAIGLLPLEAARKLAKIEPYGILVVFVLLLSGLFGQVLEPLLRFVVSVLVPDLELP